MSNHLFCMICLLYEAFQLSKNVLENLEREEDLDQLLSELAGTDGSNEAEVVAEESATLVQVLKLETKRVQKLKLAVQQKRVKLELMWKQKEGATGIEAVVEDILKQTVEVSSEKGATADQVVADDSASEVEEGATETDKQILSELATFLDIDATQQRVKNKVELKCFVQLEKSSNVCIKRCYSCARKRL